MNGTSALPKKYRLTGVSLMFTGCFPLLKKPNQKLNRRVRNVAELTTKTHHGGTETLRRYQENRLHVDLIATATILFVLLMSQLGAVAQKKSHRAPRYKVVD